MKAVDSKDSYLAREVKPVKKDENAVKQQRNVLRQAALKDLLNMLDANMDLVQDTRDQL